MHPITTFQAVVLGLLQGVTELFPVSSLGHTVLFPTLFGWHSLVRSQSDPESFWLAFVVMLHVGSAVGLLIYFWRDWMAIIAAFFRSIRYRSVRTPTERLAWLIVVASIPTGLIGLAFEHTARVALAKPTAGAIFLTLNGVILIAAERFRRRADVHALAAANDPKADGGRRLDTLHYREAATIGVAQATALIPGISRDGVCMTTGLARGLDNADAARFAFLLATPIILAAGIFKVGDLTGPLGAGVRGPAIIAAACAALASIAATAFLMRYFRNRNLVPFGIYCILFGAGMIVYTTVVSP
jgi:undecaprenyl-diphosphatase